ncbi:unnamed protein product, partial [Ectocarpus sp. 12 AP-2014]
GTVFKIFLANQKTAGTFYLHVHITTNLSQNLHNYTSESFNTSPRPGPYPIYASMPECVCSIVCGIHRCCQQVHHRWWVQDGNGHLISTIFAILSLETILCARKGIEYKLQ